MNFLPAITRFLSIFLPGLLIVAGCKTTNSDTTQTIPIAPSLTEPLKFANFTVSDINNFEGVSSLMNQKVYIGEENAAPADYEWLVSGNGTNTILAQTTREFRTGVEHRCEDETGFGRSKYQWFELCAAVLDFMAKAKPSTNSYLGHDYFMDLPGSMLVGSMSGEQEEQLDHDKLVGLRLKDYTKNGQTLHLTHIKHKGNTLTFTDSENDYDYLVRELARGDFDGDGNEDALIEVAWHTQGTLGGSFTEIVTRTRPDRDPKWVATDQFLKCTPNIVKLVGTIQNETFPGQPNYKDIKKGDELEKCWILKLRNPIDVAEDPEYPVPDENSPQLNIDVLQLILDFYPNVDYKAYEQFLNRKVIVTGELSQGFTVHHKSAIMMWVRDIKLAK